MSNANETAFPIVESHEAMGTRVSPGLTKREYFASMALQAIVGNTVISQGITEMKREAEKLGVSAMEFSEKVEFPSYAKASIAIADALLKELEDK